MAPEFDTSPFEAAMWAEVKALEKMRHDIDRLQEELKTQRESVTGAIRRYGAALQIAEKPVSHAVIRSLYWEHRDIHAESIAAGFGIEGGGGQVHLYAGDSHFGAECPGGCGKKVRLSARSSPLRECEECTARITAEREASFKARGIEHAARLADRDAWIQDQLEGGRTPEDLYVDLYARFDASGSLEHLRAMAAEVDGQVLNEF